MPGKLLLEIATRPSLRLEMQRQQPEPVPGGLPACPLSDLVRVNFPWRPLAAAEVQEPDL